MTTLEIHSKSDEIRFWLNIKRMGHETVSFMKLIIHHNIQNNFVSFARIE